MEQYKYRVMFINYGSVLYTTKIIMNEELAMEYSATRNDIFYINYMQELEDMINTIIASQRMTALIQSLINESLRHEYRHGNLLQLCLNGLYNKNGCKLL